MFPLLAHAGETLLGYEKNMLSQKNKKTINKTCLAQMGAAIYIPVPEPDCGDATKGSYQVQIKMGMLYNVNQKKAKFQQQQKSPLSISAVSVFVCENAELLEHPQLPIRWFPIHPRQKQQKKNTTFTITVNNSG